MHHKFIVFLLAAGFSHGLCAGEIYRCTAANGDVMFTNIACPAQSQVQQVASYVPEPDTPAIVPDPAAEAAAASAREAREAAAQAQAAAYQSAQAAYLQAEAAAQYAEAESQRRASEGSGYPVWVAAYPWDGARSGNDRHHRHHGHGDGKSSAPALPLPPTLPIDTSLFVRHR